MGDYLPEWATADEAERWLRAETGEDWPLPRLIEAGLRPFAWAAVRPGLHPDIVRRVYGGRPMGFMSEFVDPDDLQRIAADRRSIVVTVTRTPGGEFVRFDPPIPVDADDLRFNRESVLALAATVRTKGASAVRQSELVRRLGPRWPTIRADLSEASRNGLADAARVAGRGWLAHAAEAWATKNGRMCDGAAPASVFPSRVIRQP